MDGFPAEVLRVSGGNGGCLDGGLPGGGIPADLPPTPSSLQPGLGGGALPAGPGRPEVSGPNPCPPRTGQRALRFGRGADSVTLTASTTGTGAHGSCSWEICTWRQGVAPCTSPCRTATAARRTWQPLASRARPDPLKTPFRLSPVILWLGVVSMLTDVSSESVSAILPLYITGFLGLSTIAFGILDGINQGASAIVRIAAGYASDRIGRPKRVALAGYGLSMVARIGLLFAERVLGPDRRRDGRPDRQGHPHGPARCVDRGVGPAGIPGAALRRAPDAGQHRGGGRSAAGVLHPHADPQRIRHRVCRLAGLRRHRRRRARAPGART